MSDSRCQGLRQGVAEQRDRPRAGGRWTSQDWTSGGSAVSGPLFAYGGWTAICAAAALFGLLALVKQALSRSR